MGGLLSEQGHIVLLGFSGFRAKLHGVQLARCEQSVCRMLLSQLSFTSKDSPFTSKASPFTSKDSDAIGQVNCIGSGLCPLRHCVFFVCCGALWPHAFLCKNLLTVKVPIGT